MKRAMTKKKDSKAVIPAMAGIHSQKETWTLAFARVTKKKNNLPAVIPARPPGDLQGCANVTVDRDVESDCRELRAHGRGRYDHREVGGRVAPGAATESRVGNSGRDAGGTSPWMDEIESRLERRPRATHDCMDAGGRATHGAVAEDDKAERSDFHRRPESINLRGSGPRPAPG